MRGAQRRRGTFHQALLTAAGADAEWVDQVNEATGAAQTPDEIADSLERQVAVGRKLVQRAKARGVSCSLHEAYFVKALRFASEARSLGNEDVAPASRDGVNQGEVDRLDGACLWFLRRIVDTFESGHAADPTIPRIQVLSLRSVLRRGSREKAPVVAPVVTPVHPAIL